MEGAQDTHVSVVFVALSGECHQLRVPRDTTSFDLHCLAAACFGRKSLCLSLGSMVLPADIWQPLLGTQDKEVIINVTKTIHLGVEGGSWIDLIKRRRWEAACGILDMHACPADLVRLRDEHGDSALSWAAYYASTRPGAVVLIRRILAIAPAEARVLSSGTGFLPLHEAAWGNAAPAVAILLCASYPDAIYARARPGGETPHQVGKAMHRSFTWPSPEGLLQAAGVQHEEGNGLDITALEAVESASSERRVAEHKAEQAPPRSLAQPRQLPSLTCRGNAMTKHRPSLGAEDGCQEGVQHLREACAKACGRLAGARKTRHNRCGFIDKAEVVVGPFGAVHRLRLHAARAVNESVARGHVVAKWPCKAGPRRARALDRTLKFGALAVFLQD